MFLLPARIPHSPQRQANTVGLVVERKRLRSETDCLRYYVDNSTDILFERWFYCENLGTQLVPVIQEFMASKQHKTGKPDPDKWIKDNEASFLPPVCNKLMFFYQLNIMYVGGPNIRKDYHIEEGEELFYQIRGDMVLKVIENGKHKDVHIREGEMFLLPARIPHSPQRQANTVGLVVERKRLRSETDCLRYYVDNSTDILFERWFYCENLGTQLVPVIQEFMASKQHKTGKPDPADPIKPPPYPLNTMNVMTPFSFKDWVEKQKPALVSGRPLDMFGNQFETEVMLYGPGESETSKRTSDGWIWQLEGSSSVSMNGQDYNLSVGDCLLVLGLTEYHWQKAEDCVALYVVQNPERKRPF